MEPIRVLHVVASMDKGGLESRLMDIIRNVDTNRVIIDVYTNSHEQGYFDNEIELYGGRVFYSSSNSMFHLLRKVLDFKRFLKNHKEYSIVHVHRNELSTLYCAGASMAGVPVRIAHSRGANIQLSLSRLFKDIIKLPLKKYATNYFAVSVPAAIRLFGKRSYAQGQVMIWPNAIDCRKFVYNPEVRTRIRTQLGLENAFVIIHVGNFTIPKNHDFLLYVFRELKKKEQTAKLVLVGGGKSERYLTKAASLGITDSVLFLGSRSDVDELLQAGDVFVFPSLHEGFPGAVLEAQAAGLPCVISNSITSEVCLLSTTKQLPLSASPDRWAQEILLMKDSVRKDTYDAIVQAGYDVVSLSEKLTMFYETSIGKERTCE